MKPYLEYDKVVPQQPADVVQGEGEEQVLSETIIKSPQK